MKTNDSETARALKLARQVASAHDVASKTTRFNAQWAGLDEHTADRLALTAARRATENALVRAGVAPRMCRHPESAYCDSCRPAIALNANVRWLEG